MEFCRLKMAESVLRGLLVDGTTEPDILENPDQEWIGDLFQLLSKGQYRSVLDKFKIQHGSLVESLNVLSDVSSFSQHLESLTIGSDSEQ